MGGSCLAGTGTCTIADGESDALRFILPGVAPLVRLHARAHLLPAVAVLLLATAVVAGLYLFPQNWVHTIVVGDYVGWTCFACLGIVGALLGDLLLTRGRVNGRIVSPIGGIFASGALAPC